MVKIYVLEPFNISSMQQASFVYMWIILQKKLAIAIHFMPSNFKIITNSLAIRKILYILTKDWFSGAFCLFVCLKEDLIHNTA